MATFVTRTSVERPWNGTSARALPPRVTRAVNAGTSFSFVRAISASAMRAKAASCVLRKRPSALRTLARYAAIFATWGWSGATSASVARTMPVVRVSEDQTAA